LVRALEGRILDVAVDLRKESDTYGEWIAVELSAENKKQLYVPRGFAHGFSVLSETAAVFYKCDNLYHKASEGGILYNDPDLNIDWQVSEESMIISEKDIELNSFKSLN
jgi:dTDP-4-dehydrorhamnose 3,5-epimerase